MFKSHAAGRKEDNRPTSGQKKELRNQINRGQVTGSDLQHILTGRHDLSWLLDKQQDPLAKFQTLSPNRRALIAENYEQRLPKSIAHMCEVVVEEISSALTGGAITLQPELPDLAVRCAIATGWHQGNFERLHIVRLPVDPTNPSDASYYRSVVERACKRTVYDELSRTLRQNRVAVCPNAIEAIDELIESSPTTLGLAPTVGSMMPGDEDCMEEGTWPHEAASISCAFTLSLALGCNFRLQGNYRNHLRWMMRHLAALHLEGNIPFGFTPENDLVVFCADDE